MRKLRLMVSGSAALPMTVLERWREITGHTLLERYGMTEFGMGLSNPLDMGALVSFSPPFLLLFSFLFSLSSFLLPFSLLTTLRPSPLTPHPPARRRAGYVGAPLPSVEAKIVKTRDDDDDDDNGGDGDDGDDGDYEVGEERECGAGEAGELRIRGANVFREYLNRPEATAAE